METRRLVIGMILAMAVVFGWQFFVASLYKRHPEWAQKPPTTQVATTAPAVAPSTRSATSAPGVEAEASTQPAALGTLAVSSQPAEPVNVTLGEPSEFPVQVSLSGQQAAIQLATLKNFKAADAKNVYTFQEPTEADQSRLALGTRAVVINGQTLDLTNARWTLDQHDQRSAHFSLELKDPSAGGKPVAVLHKTFELTGRDDPSRGYTLAVRQSIENRTGSPLTARLVFAGPNLPPRELLSGPDQQIVGAYDEEGSITVQSHPAMSFQKDKVSQDLLNPGKKELTFAWLSAASVYFDAILRPLPQPGTEGLPVARWLSRVQALALNPDSAIDQRQVIVELETTDLSVAPGTPAQLDSELFLGPKKRELLNTPFYDAYPRSYNRTLVIASGMCAICTFQWLINILVWMLWAFHWVWGGFAGHGDWGLAIITLVLIVRAILHPITKKSQISMSRMGKMGPEVERLKKKFGDDKEGLNKAMMELYKQQGATPILGCLPMFLQMPIWIALWSALQSTFELRQAPFLWGFTWIHDLSRPDLFIDFGHDVKLFWSFHLAGINLLPILMGVVFFLQQKFTPKPPAANEQQAQQQKMMQWMSLLFPLFLYNGPSGLNLYILTSTTIGIFESKIVRDHLKQQEEAEKAGRVIVDAGPTRGMKRRKDEEEGGSGARRLPGGGTPPKKGGLMGWIAELQNKAEQLRREAERKSK